MKKKIIIVILMFLVIFVSIAKASLLDNILLPFQFLFEIIFPSSPEILEAKIEPIKVEPSDWMIITAKVKDKYGIESVKADMAGIEIVELKLISGNENEGIYQASWFVHSVEVGKTYNATIIARNVKGKESFFVLQFYDDPVFCCRINISNLQFFPLSPEIIGISLDTASLISQGKMRNDCGDIRFTDSKAFDSAFWTRNFSYNLVSGCNSANTIFFVEVPSGVTSFYAYYGNPQVTSISNSSISGFTYRIPITITERSGNTLTEYQVLVSINTQNLISQGKMRNDCGDIRFTDSDGITLLSYWLESGCNSANTKIWVKVPNIPANSNKTIYLYYGNLSATSASNKTSVLTYFSVDSGSVPILCGSSCSGGTTYYGTWNYSLTNEVFFEVNLTRYAGTFWDYCYIGHRMTSPSYYDFGTYYVAGNCIWQDGGTHDLTSYLKNYSYVTLQGYWTCNNCASHGIVCGWCWAQARFVLTGYKRKYISPEPTISLGNEEIPTAALGPKETWIRISGGEGNLLITGGGGTLKIK
ncbi:MAG: DUF2341 domain-containing protein [candidate division WOR-3 bacterium]